MKRIPSVEPNLIRETSWLVLFQALGLLIPLATLPVMARSLHVLGFGQVMLAQILVSVGVTFVDAGFNTESQRRVAIAASTLEAHQALVDNIIARSISAIFICLIVLIVAWFLPSLPFNLVLISLLLVLGTLLFPQWWFVVKHEGFKMGIVATIGRLLSAAVIIAFVHTKDDAWIAALAMSTATVFSGLIMFPQLKRQLSPSKTQINLQGWKQYLRDIKPTIFSSFFANASSSVPAILLGTLGNGIQTGLYTASDRLTRAAAYLIGFIEQSLMGFMAKLGQTNPTHLSKIRKRILTGIALVMLIACTAGIALAGWVLELLYGQAFSSSKTILQILIAWLFLYSIRKAGTTFFFVAMGKLTELSRSQWAEAIMVLLFCALGGYWDNAVGIAIALCLVELFLIAFVTKKWMDNKRRGHL